MGGGSSARRGAGCYLSYVSLSGSFQVELEKFHLNNLLLEIPVADTTIQNYVLYIAKVEEVLPIIKVLDAVVLQQHHTYAYLEVLILVKCFVHF